MNEHRQLLEQTSAAHLLTMPAAKRYGVMVARFGQLQAEMERRDGERGSVQAANTYAGALLTEFLITAAITKLQNKWAALKVFSRDFSVDRLNPLAPAETKFVVSGATAQTNATNFESGNSTVNAVKITPSQYTVSFNVSNADLQSGLRMADLLEVNLRAFGDALVQAATAPLTVGNFTSNSPLISAYATFDWDDMRLLWAALSKSEVKNAVLDGPYMARLTNTPGFFQKTGTGPGGNRWQDFGWDAVELNTNWTGAGANVRGLACNPQVLGCLAGLPLSTNSPILKETIITIPEIDLSVAMNSWFNPATRTAWASFDSVFGASLLDESAGVLIKSA